MPRVVLVTGVRGYLGSRLCGQLSADPSVDRIVGVDTAPPTKADLARLGRAEFVRADIRNPLIARVMAHANVDTVVHASVTATPRGAGGRTPMKEFNVIGTMQLLAACQKSEAVRRLVVKSTTAVYGSSPRDPAVFTEDTEARGLPRSGYAKDAVEVESYVRGFSRRRPDICVTMLRFANFIGPTIETPLTRYLALRVVPTGLGYDPRLQLLHEDDAIEVLRMATMSDRPGVFNVAGEGALLLSQAIRREGHLSIPVPAFGVQFASRFVRRRGVDFSPEQLQFLNFGRVVDVTKLQRDFSYRPQYTTAEAFAAFVSGRPVRPVIPANAVRRGEELLLQALRVPAAPAPGVASRG